MNRTFLVVASVGSASSLLLADSTIKGTVLLILAAVVTLLLRRDSAATRHLVWLVAIVAMLAIPILSATLPQWRVLPEWARISMETEAVPTRSSAVAGLGDRAVEFSSIEPFEKSTDANQPLATEFRPDSPPSPLQPATETSKAIHESALWTWNWFNLVPSIWTAGFLMLTLRLIAARAILWSFESRGTVVWSSRLPAQASDDPLIVAMKAVSLQFPIRRPVTLLIQSHRAIPLVWGIFHSRLMLPLEARNWDSEQLRSVLLHELAHIQRRDTLTQLLTQIACAIHWFNPLVWYAAWQMEVERERACDDLVLASGVRPSAYAGHLLEVASGLTSVRWMQPCGLAMARKSSIESRLEAVLSTSHSRRRVTVALAGLALLVAVGVAIPIAILHAADGTWEPPHAVHGWSDAYAVHNGKQVSFIITSRRHFGSSSNNTSNAVARTWNIDVKLTWNSMTPQKEVSFRCNHTAPDKLTLAGKEYDLTHGRIFLISDDCESTRQLAMNPPPIPQDAGLEVLNRQIGEYVKQAQQPGSPPPKDDVQLDPAVAENLQWGEPHNGLRAALFIRKSPEIPRSYDKSELYLALQNVSDAAIRLSDTVTAPKLRGLSLKVDREIQTKFVSKDPTGTDVVVEPRKIVYLLMFAPDPKQQGPRSTGSIIAEITLRNSHQALVGELDIQTAPAGAWTGKLVTGETTGAIASGQTPPKDKTAKLLFNTWQHRARLNGNFPGGLIGRLREKVQNFIRLNTGDDTGDPYAKKMAPLVARLDATRDWSPAELVAMLNDIAAVTPVPLYSTKQEFMNRTFRTGTPLPPELANAPWGEAQSNGLRMAWLVEPRATEHRLGSRLKSRILLHNSGRQIAVFRTRTWHQGKHQALDGNGAKIPVTSIMWTTLPQFVPIRLWPGEFIELSATGIGIEPQGDPEDGQLTRVGSWIHPAEGDLVTVKTDPIPLYDWNQKPTVNGDSGWWLEFIQAYFAEYLPLPPDLEERKHLFYRASMDLFGNPHADQTQFLAASAPTSFDTLARSWATEDVADITVTAYNGSLTSGPTTFRVIPVDPDDAKRPRTATDPGRYTLNENARLIVARMAPMDVRVENKASIEFFSRDPNRPAPAKPHVIKLPDQFNTWAAGWFRGGTVLWILQKGNVRSYDFTDPANVVEASFADPGDLDKVPEAIVDAQRAALVVPVPPKRPIGPPAVPVKR